MNIEIVKVSVPQVNKALRAVKSLSPGTAWRLFRKEAMQHVVCIAIEWNASGDVPLAFGTLAFGDSFPDMPEVAGIWVHPEYRKQGKGWNMLVTLLQEAHERYGKEAHIGIFAVSPGGRELVSKATNTPGEMFKNILPVWSGGSGEQDLD